MSSVSGLMLIPTPDFSLYVNVLHMVTYDTAGHLSSQVSEFLKIEYQRNWLEQ